MVGAGVREDTGIESLCTNGSESVFVREDSWLLSPAKIGMTGGVRLQEVQIPFLGNPVSGMSSSRKPTVTKVAT